MKRELFRQREEAVRTNHPDIPLAVPELRQPWWPEEHGEGGKPGTVGQLPRGMTLGQLQHAEQQLPSCLLPQGTTSPQVALQLSPRGTCPASGWKAKTLLKIGGRVLLCSVD